MASRSVLPWVRPVAAAVFLIAKHEILGVLAIPETAEQAKAARVSRFGARADWDPMRSTFTVVTDPVLPLHLTRF
jgi:hypothetical protein